MDIEELVTRAGTTYSDRGFFKFSSVSPEKQPTDEIEGKEAPNEPGVYVIYAKTNEGMHILQIGKAGILKDGGSFTPQKLKGRLSRGKQRNENGERVMRKELFRNEIAKPGVQCLIIYWFVTFGGGVRIIPAKAEADLLQAYFDACNRLPPWKRAI